MVGLVDLGTKCKYKCSHPSVAATRHLPDVRWMVALLGLVAGLTSTAAAGDVCEAYTRIPLSIQIPHYSFMFHHFQVQVKLKTVSVHVHATKYCRNTCIQVYTYVYAFVKPTTRTQVRTHTCTHLNSVRSLLLLFQHCFISFKFHC